MDFFLSNLYQERDGDWEAYPPPPHASSGSRRRSAFLNFLDFIFYLHFSQGSYQFKFIGRRGSEDGTYKSQAPTHLLPRGELASLSPLPRIIHMYCSFTTVGTPLIPWGQLGSDVFKANSYWIKKSNTPCGMSRLVCPVDYKYTMYESAT